jgi:hypothetical protein
VIQTFVSRPTWAPPEIEQKLSAFYQLLEDTGFKANTIGTSQAPLRSPFEDVKRLIKKCKCTIVLGLPQVFIETGSLKTTPLAAPVAFATEWNQIEATMSLMLDLPTLVLLHDSVAARGIFDRGAANVFVYGFNVREESWLSSIRPGLNSLKESIDP